MTEGERNYYGTCGDTPPAVPITSDQELIRTALMEHAKALNVIADEYPVIAFWARTRAERATYLAGRME